MSAPFAMYEYFAPNAQKADPGAPGAAQRSPAAEQSRARWSLFGWVGLLGFATYGLGLGVALDAWLR